MKYFLATVGLSVLTSLSVFAQKNPVIGGWYADPEGIKYGDTYWIFPTYSAKYNEQFFFDGFSSKDLVHWQKYPGNPIIGENKSSGIMIHDGKRYRLYTMHDKVCVHFPLTDSLP